MYTQFFSLTQAPFSIAPDPRYLFMTQGHREALAHLLYGVNGGGGVVLLTGEIGAGKTTVCRCFLEQVPDNCKVAYIFNPKLSVEELLQAICDEFGITLAAPVTQHGGTTAVKPTVKNYVDALTRHLLAAHARGLNSILIIDEAQNLSADVLEQLRLLTNLETNERKLLQIVLIGQPELRAMLERPELTQLAQRVIARYHLQPLEEDETASYVRFRLAIAGLTAAQPFGVRALKRIHRLTAGVPRRINLICDRALLGAYAEGRHDIDRRIIDKAAAEVFGRAQGARARSPRRYVAAAAVLFGAVGVGATVWTMSDRMQLAPAKTATAAAVVENIAGSIAESATSEAIAEETPPVASAASPADAGASPRGWTDADEAARKLALLWNVSPATGDACDAAQEQGLYCYRSGKGLAELRQLDRPALLTLQDANEQRYQVMLTALTGTSATIRTDDAFQELSLVMLMRHFHGEFMTYWRAPHPYSGTLARGDRGPQVDWIAEQLARVNGRAESSTERIYDERMVQEVREFQAAQGLRPDGVVGPVTFMHLNRVAGVAEPRLLRSTALAGSPAAKE